MKIRISNGVCRGKNRVRPPDITAALPLPQYGDRWQPKKENRDWLFFYNRQPANADGAIGASRISRSTGARCRRGALLVYPLPQWRCCDPGSTKDGGPLWGDTTARPRRL